MKFTELIEYHRQTKTYTLRVYTLAPRGIAPFGHNVVYAAKVSCNSLARL